MLGMTVNEAVAFVGLLGIVNGGGRIFYSSLSDRIGRNVVYLYFFMTESIAFFLLRDAENLIWFQLLSLHIISCYGGGFSCMPAYVADLFGAKYLSAIHGRILTAWGFAGLFGPTVCSYVYETLKSPKPVFLIFSMMFVVSSLLMATLGGLEQGRAKR